MKDLTNKYIGNFEEIPKDLFDLVKTPLLDLYNKVVEDFPLKGKLEIVYFYAEDEHIFNVFIKTGLPIGDFHKFDELLFSDWYFDFSQENNMIGYFLA
ncbi:MAG: hypothetical protein COB02_12280 [Candidatus Cloacimonadota bacterium]|nr:MAG: hypothetical protein COB02_12280 [Candidatus Cloacimonadota bacterium]